MRPPVDTIPIPLFPRDLPWCNVASLRIEKQRGRPVLIEFWDFCRVSSLRTLPYVKAWHERYAEAGLRVISVHSPGFPPSRDEQAVRDAVERLGIEHPVVIDTELKIWRVYENKGWPARYLWNRELRLFEYHYGEGAYAETERAIQELVGIDGDVVAPVRPEDEPEALLVVPTEEVAGPYSGPYGAGAVWVVAEGSGTMTVNGDELEVTHPGAVEVVRHDVHTEGVVEIVPGDGVTVHATTFTPGLAPEGAEPSA